MSQYYTASFFVGRCRYNSGKYTELQRYFCIWCGELYFGVILLSLIVIIGVCMKGIRIRPEQDGLKVSLFDLEAEIMDIIWDGGLENFSVQDIFVILQGRREIAYTTVMTTVARLYEKNLLSRKKDGKKYTYSPAKTREDFIVDITKKVVASLPPLGQETAMALLVDMVSDADESELDRLEKLIQARKSAL